MGIPRHRTISGEAEGPARWPDRIRCTADDLLMVSRRVLKALREAGVTGFRSAHRVILKEIATTGKPSSPPDYYYLDVTGTIDIDWAASGMEVEGFCEHCHAEERRTDPVRLIPRLETWDGSDIFRIRNYDSGYKFCTEKILNLARENRWLGFRFFPMDIPHDVASSRNAIDYLGKRWPPAWYPPGITGQFGF